MKPFRIVLTIFALTMFSQASALAAEAPRGRLAGGVHYDLPGWFKNSFLVLSEDVEEAGQRGRHLMLFMHLDECPYCARLLKENFREGETKEFMEKHFDVIGINVRGGKTTEWIDGKSYSETELARQIKVVATPTLVFLDAKGKVVLQLNGYRKPPVLRRALEYVQGKHYLKQDLPSFVEQQANAATYWLREDPRFSAMTDFKGFAKPLAMIFEDKDCTDCEEFHAKVLNHPDVQPELTKYTVVRLDAYSDSAIVDLDGNKTTPRAWAKQMNIVYRPGIVFFNEGRERMRMDGMQYKYHFKELLRYVSGQHYREHSTFSSYNAARREELLSRGEVIDYAQ